MVKAVLKSYFILAWYDLEQSGPGLFHLPPDNPRLPCVGMSPSEGAVQPQKCFKSIGPYCLLKTLAWVPETSSLLTPFSLLSPLPEDSHQQRPGAGHCSWVTSGYVFHLPFPAVGWMEIEY